MVSGTSRPPALNGGMMLDSISGPMRVAQGMGLAWTKLSISIDLRVIGLLMARLACRDVDALITPRAEPDRSQFPLWGLVS